MSGTAYISCLAPKLQKTISHSLRYQKRALRTAILTAAKAAAAASVAMHTLFESLPEFEPIAGASQAVLNRNSTAIASASAAASKNAGKDDEEGYGYSDEEFEKCVRFSDHVQVLHSIMYSRRCVCSSGALMG